MDGAAWGVASVLGSRFVKRETGEEGKGVLVSKKRIKGVPKSSLKQQLMIRKNIAFWPMRGYRTR